MRFADKLQILRLEHNLSQEQLAERLGVSRQAITKWESGKSYPEIQRLITLSNIFNVKVDYLIKEDFDEKSIEGKERENSQADNIKESEIVTDTPVKNYNEVKKYIFLFLIVGMIFIIFMQKVIGRTNNFTYDRDTSSTTLYYDYNNSDKVL